MSEPITFHRPDSNMLPREILNLEKSLSEKLYLVTMRFIDSISLRDMQLYGVPGFRNKQLTAAVHNEPITVGKNALELICLHESGITYQFNSPNAGKEIYMDICNYILEWDRYKNRSINHAHPNIELLQRLDDYASKIYRFAHAHVSSINKDTSFVNNYKIVSADEIANTISRNREEKMRRGALANNQLLDEERQKIDNKEIVRHKSLMEGFMDNSISASKWYNRNGN